MTVFDPIKAIKEEITGLANVRTTYKQAETRAMTQMGVAENELIAARKMLGFVDAEMARKRTVLKQLEEQTNG